MWFPLCCSKKLYCNEKSLCIFISLEYILSPTLSKQNFALSIPVQLLLSRTSVTSMLLNTVNNSKTSSHMNSGCTHSCDSLTQSYVFIYYYMLITPRCLYLIQISFPDSRLIYPTAYLTFLLGCLIHISSKFVRN